MPHYRKLVGEKCYLSPSTLEDATLWAAWPNDLEVAIPLGDEAYSEPTVADQEAMIANATQHRFRVFTIVELEHDTPIGRGLLFDIDPVNRRAMLGIFIGEKGYWNRGVGQDAVRLLLDYGFHPLNLHNIMLGVMAFNERAIQCYRRVGFREIGRRREATIIAGKKYDSILMDMLAEEFGASAIRKVVEQEVG